MDPKKVNWGNYDLCCSILQTYSALNHNILVCTCWDLLHNQTICSTINTENDKSTSNRHKRQVVVLLNFPDGKVRPFP
jgi:hypothetical protein